MDIIKFNNYKRLATMEDLGHDVVYTAMRDGSTIRNCRRCRCSENSFMGVMPCGKESLGKVTREPGMMDGKPTWDYIWAKTVKIGYEFV